MAIDVVFHDRLNCISFNCAYNHVVEGTGTWMASSWNLPGSLQEPEGFCYLFKPKLDKRGACSETLVAQFHTEAHYVVLCRYLSHHLVSH